MQGEQVSSRYSVQKFAQITGVTVKALRHYDRLGLLKPTRTGAGYRMYTDRDLERLQQIVALKFLGLSLKQIKTVLDRPPLQLGDALRLQRKVLEEKQWHLTRAIHAIREAECTLESGKPPSTETMRRVIDVIHTYESIDVMKRYYSEEAWAKDREYYRGWPSQHWKDLYRDVEAALGQDP